MNAREAKRNFINDIYGSDRKYRKARRDDYCKVQFEWTCYMNWLCKDGIISQRTFNKAVF